MRRLMHWAWERGWFEDARWYERRLTKYESMTDEEFVATYVGEPA